MKINYRNKGISMDTKIRIATDYNAKMPIKDILMQYDISKTTLFNILNELVDKDEGQEVN